MYADPVIGESFFGRREVIELLTKRIDSLKGGYRQNIAITGKRLCGKTSLIHHFIYTLKDSNIIPIYIEITDNSFEGFVDKFIGTLLYNFSKTYLEKVPEDITSLLETGPKLIPKTIDSVQKIRALLKEQKFEDAFNLLFNLTSIIREETGKSCIVILDEFHNLDLFNLKNPFANFGKRIMIQKDTMYIVASSEVSKIKKILSEKLALLFGNFEKIEIDHFNSKVSKEFIKKRLREIRIHDEILNFLVYFVDGHPYYMDVIADKISSKLEHAKFKIITKSLIFDIIEEELFRSKGTFNQYFMNSIASFQLNDQNRNFMDVMGALGDGRYTLKGISESLQGRSPEIGEKLDYLEESDFIVKKGTFYGFVDRVMEFWLKNVYSIKQKSFIIDITETIKKFRKNLETLYQEFLDDSKLSLSARLMPLIGSFNNEIVEIDKKSHRLIKFSKITEYAGKDNLILSETESKKWVFVIEGKETTEADLSGYLGLLKNDPEIDKIILVALSGLEMNARLLAKESKMWIWEIEDVNFLMDAYRRFRIVL